MNRVQGKGAEGISDRHESFAEHPISPDKMKVQDKDQVQIKSSNQWAF